MRGSLTGSLLIDLFNRLTSTLNDSIFSLLLISPFPGKIYFFYLFLALVWGSIFRIGAFKVGFAAFLIGLVLVVPYPQWISKSVCKHNGQPLTFMLAMQRSNISDDKLCASVIGKLNESMNRSIECIDLV